MQSLEPLQEFLSRLRQVRCHTGWLRKHHVWQQFCWLVAQLVVDTLCLLQAFLGYSE